MSQALNNINHFCFFTVVVICCLSVINYILKTGYSRSTVKNSGGSMKNGRKQHAFRYASEKTIELDDRYYLCAVLLVFFIAFLVRIWQFGIVPGGINQDEAMAAVDGKAISDYGTDRFGTHAPVHLNGWGYAQMSVLLSYLCSIFIKIWGLNVITARLPLLIVSMAGAVFFFLFVKDIFGKNVGLAAAAFVAVNPWHFLQSRWSIDCNLLPHFFIAAMYFFNKGLCGKKVKKYIFFCISMILFALCMYCYGITIYTIPPLLVAMVVYYMLKKQIKFGDVLFMAGVYLLFAWPFLLTMAVNYFKWDTIELPFATIQYFADSIRSKDILFFTKQPFRQLGSNLLSLLNVTLFQKRDLPWNEVDGFGTMFLCTMPFVFVGIIEFIRRKSSGMKSLAVFAVVGGLLAGLITNNVNINRANIIYYGIMIFAVLGMAFTVRELFVFLFVDVSIYAMLAVMLFSTYFGSYAQMVGTYYYVGFGDAIIKAENSGVQRIYVTANTQFEGSYNVSEILTLFYAETDAEYFQGKTNWNKGYEMWPYTQRYIYTDISAELVQRAAEEDAAYVVRRNETEYFDSSIYDIVDYGDYSVIVPRYR